MQRYSGFRNAKSNTDMSVFLVIANEFDNFDNFDNILGCPVCRSKNAQDLPIRIVDLTP